MASGAPWGPTATVATSARTTSRAPSVADLRIGIVGAGWIAGTHAATLALLDGARVVASADVVPGRGDYVDWRAMLRAERLDALVVCTPPDVHREVTVAAARAGLAVYLEKPVAHTMDDAAAIAAAVKATGVVCAVGYQYRAISFLGDLPRDAALLLGTGISDTADRAWLGDRARGGGMMLERASHLIDLERALAGEVTVRRRSRRGPGSRPRCGWGGAVGSVVVGRVAGGPGWRRLELIRDAGPVTVELDPVFARAGPAWISCTPGRRRSSAPSRVLRRRGRAAATRPRSAAASTTASGRSRSRWRRRTPRSRRSPRWTPSAPRARRPRWRSGGRRGAGGQDDSVRPATSSATAAAPRLRVARRRARGRQPRARLRGGRGVLGPRG